jgi:hypothetical protein
MSIPKIGTGVGSSVTNYSIDDILSMTEPKKTGGFRKVLGGIAGGVANVVLPGVGGAVENLINGGAGASGGLLGEAGQFLELQRQIQAEARAFETASNILKVQHDASETAIRNMKS